MESGAKRAAAAAALAARGAGALVVTALDEVAWLLNVRGSDVAFNPVCFAFCVLRAGGDATLYAARAAYASPAGVGRMRIPNLFLKRRYVEPEKAADPSLLAHLGPDVALRPYGALCGDLGALPAGARVWVDPATCSWEVYRALPEGAAYEAPSPLVLPKALKCPAEARSRGRAADMHASCARVAIRRISE